MYDLYGVLVHHGHSVHSGHYLSYVRNASGLWHICDDTRVAQVRGREVQADMRETGGDGRGAGRCEGNGGEWEMREGNG